MNWILSIIYFMFIFIHYYLLGDRLITIFDYKPNISKKMIAGFFGTYFCTFIIGFPSQMLHISWNLYFVIQSLFFCIIDIFLIYLKRKDIISFWKQFTLKKGVYSFVDLVKNNWISVLFVILFSIISMANQLPVYQMNYDDFYYIGKITNLVGSPHLLNEDYYSGALIVNNGLDIVRTINTYELSYGFFSSVFHIDVTFFCRATMVVHNYIFFTLIYKELGSIIIPRKYTQFALIPFFLFIIPQGYLHNTLFLGVIPSIRSYDLWQFQTAAFYGGSVVRMLSLPTLFLFSYPMLNRLDIKKICWIALLSFSFISFSTIFLQIFILFFIMIFFVFFITQLVHAIQSNNTRISLLSIFSIFVIVAIMILTKGLDHLSFINTENFRSSYAIYADFDQNWVQHDLILKLAPVVLILGFLLSKKTERMLYIFVGGFYVIFKSSMFYEFLTVTSFNAFFVIYRSISSVQYLCLFLFGICLIQCYSKMLKTVGILHFTSIAFIACVVVFFFTNTTVFVNYHYNGSGISADGWNFRRVFTIDNTMTAKIFYNVGEFFNSLPYGNYRFFAPSVFSYDGINTLELGFMMSSNRIQIHERGGFEGMTKEDSSLLSNYCLGLLNEPIDINYYMTKYDIQFMLVSDETAVNELKELGAKVVFVDQNVSGDYYLLEL